MQHGDYLEGEAIYILREAAAQFKKPAILFSGGKDSVSLVHLARKAFYPTGIPFPLLHVDTGHNFPEVLEFRDRLAREMEVNLVIASVEDCIRQGLAIDPPKSVGRNKIQSVALLHASEKFGFDALIGGGRRDEEKARAKERIFSVRNALGQWDPEHQRPELWNLFNGKLLPGQSMRVFPLSNWTERDVWQFIAREEIALPSLYYAHRRKCIRRGNGVLLAEADCLAPLEQDSREDLVVRCRTVGDIPCTGLMESFAASAKDVLRELEEAFVSERGYRADDQFSETAMEERKREGYF